MKRKIAIGVGVSLTIYVAVFLSWSRSQTWITTGPTPLWSFYNPPAGLLDLDDVRRHYTVPGRDRMHVWRERERIPGLIFRPCILVDELLTNRRYYPLSHTLVCFN